MSSKREKEDASRGKPSVKDGGLDIRSKTGGAYIPPAKLRMMQEQITDKSSEAYQVSHGLFG